MISDVFIGDVDMDESLAVRSEASDSTTAWYYCQSEPVLAQRLWFADTSVYQCLFYQT